MLWSWSLDKIFPLHLPHRICALRSWDMALPRLYHCSVRRNIFYQCRDVFKGLRRHWPCCSHEEFTPLFPLKISVRNWAHELPHKCSSTSLLYIYIFLSSFLLFSSLFFLFSPLSKPPCEGFPGVYEFPWAQQHFKHFFPARAAGKVHSENLGVLCHKTHGKRRESRGREWMCVQSRVWFLDVSLGRIWFKIPDVSSFSMRDSGCRHVCRAAAAPAASAPTEERLASSQNKKKGKGKIE